MFGLGSIAAKLKEFYCDVLDDGERELVLYVGVYVGLYLAGLIASAARSDRERREQEQIDRLSSLIMFRLRQEAPVG